MKRKSKLLAAAIALLADFDFGDKAKSIIEKPRGIYASGRPTLSAVSQA